MAQQINVDGNWFRGQLADKRISQRELAKRLDLDPAAISLMLRGRRKMSAAEAAEISRMLGVGVDEVLTRAGAGVPTKREKPDRIDVAVTTKAPTNAGGAIGSDAEFLMRWMELGNYLLNRGR